MLKFRRVRDGDVAAVHRLHADPATNVYNPYGASATIDASRCLLREWLDHWFRYGFGYELAFAGDQLAGIGGARWDDWDGIAVQNLYWRLLPDFQGRGLSAVIAARGREIASRQPGRPLVIARMLPMNIASIHVAGRAGMRRRADLDAEFDGFRWVVFAERPALQRRGEAGVRRD